MQDANSGAVLNPTCPITFLFAAKEDDRISTSEPLAKQITSWRNSHGLSTQLEVYISHKHTHRHACASRSAFVAAVSVGGRSWMGKGGIEMGCIVKSTYPLQCPHRCCLHGMQGVLSHAGRSAIHITPYLSTLGHGRCLIPIMMVSPHLLEFETCTDLLMHCWGCQRAHDDAKV